VSDRNRRHPPAGALLAELERRCRQLGTPLTVQRRAVLAALAARDDHPTADRVFRDVSRRLPGVSRGTTYRTLDTLVALGLVVKVSHPGSSARYDAKVDRHHHLICDRCGGMTDLDSDALDRVQLPELAGTGFHVRDFSVHVRGLCQRCTTASPGSPPLRRARRRRRPASPTRRKP
jgi:Fur family peroxide stress response transcriptional regulator